MQALLTLADGRGSSAAPRQRPSPSTTPALAPPDPDQLHTFTSLPPPPRPSPSSLSIVSANVHGINDAPRRAGLFRDIALHAPDVICLQETKLAESETFIQSLWNGPSFWGVRTRLKPRYGRPSSKPLKGNSNAHECSTIPPRSALTLYLGRRVFPPGERLCS